MKLLATFILLLVAPLCGMATGNGSALPPPVGVQDSPVAQEIILSENDHASLQEELSPDSKSAEDIRVYRRKDGTTVEEYSIRGRVYMIRIKPPGDLPAYYLYDDEGDGKFERRLPGGYKRTTPPTWVIKRF